MDWNLVEEQAARIRSAMPGDQFVEAVLAGSLQVAKDPANGISGNLFAAGVRELMGYALHTLASDENVSKASWFEPVKNTSGPTRKQRAIYIAQGGLSDGYLREELGLDPSDIHKKFIDSIDELSKHTHLRPGRVLTDKDAVLDLALRSLSAFADMLGVAAECRKLVASKLAEHVDREMVDRFLGEVMPELDELSTHTTVDTQHVDEIEVSKISWDYITYEVHGTVFVELQYGSNSDIRNDMGAILSDSYPYTANLAAPVSEPGRFLEDFVEIKVDNSGFYE